MIMMRISTAKDVIVQLKFFEKFFFKYLKKSFFGSGDNLFRFCEWYIKLEIYKLDVMNVRRRKKTQIYMYTTTTINYI